MNSVIHILNKKIQSYKNIVEDLELLNERSMSKSDHQIALSLHCIDLLSSIINQIEQNKATQHES